MTLDETRQLYAFLRTGRGPKGFRLRARPRLSWDAAFSVIYVLQEKFRLVPDTFEQCVRCHEIFDSAETGEYDEETGKHYCDAHIPAGKNGDGNG